MAENKNRKIVYFSHYIPDSMDRLIDDEFLKTFRNQLYRINHYHLDTFAEESLAKIHSISWKVAIYKACKLTDKKELLDFWKILQDDTVDVFDDILADLLVKKHFILGNVSDVIKQQLGVSEQDLQKCNYCQKYYTKDMMIQFKDIRTDESDYVCFYCNDRSRTKDKSRQMTDYYRDCLRSMSEYLRY